MASFTCHVVGGTKRVRVERIVRRDHPAEVKCPQGRLNRSLENRAHPANCQRRTLRSRNRWADNVSASTRRTWQPKPTSAIGRASCRERECQYVSLSVVAVSLKKKQKQKIS